MLLLESNKCSAKIYNALNVGPDIMQKLVLKWQSKGFDIDNEQLREAFKAINKITNIVKYWAFQYRLLHNIVYLNDRLVHFGIVKDNLCTLCNSTKEMVLHLFCTCTKTRHFWQEIRNYVQKVNEEIEELTWSAENILLNNVHASWDRFENLTVLLAKQHIFAKKCKKESLNHVVVIKEIEFTHDIEFNNAMTSGRYSKYNRRLPDKISMDSHDIIDEEIINYINTIEINQV